MTTEPEPIERAARLAERASEPAVAGNVLCGTAGWTDRTLIQSRTFYPRGATTAADRLRFYARHFRLVEVDSTYYSLLPPSTAERWMESTPSDFVFDVKAFPVFTGHPIEVVRLPPDLRAALSRSFPDTARVYPDRLPEELRVELERRFLDLTKPLHAAARLGCVMVQYPPWFSATRGNARQLESLRQRLEQLPVSVEFRHRSWLLPERQPRVFDLLRAQGFCYVCVDEPPGRVGGLPPLVEVTQPELALVRFHGRNQRGWEKAQATVHERFDYLYLPEELAGWTDPIRRLGELAQSVHAIFNNCVRNYAILGAKGMAALLSQDSPAPAEPP